MMEKPSVISSQSAFYIFAVVEARNYYRTMPLCLSNSHIIADLRLRKMKRSVWSVESTYVIGCSM